MLTQIKKNQNLIMLFIEIALVYLGFWFLLNNLNTNGVWETVILNILFFLVFPVFILKGEFKNQYLLQKIKSKLNIKVCGQVLVFWIIVLILFLKFDFLIFLKLNYLSRVDWFLTDWWAIFFIDLILIPLILFSQEFFFRNFLLNKLKNIFSIKIALIIQAGLFVLFEVLFFEIFQWQFVLFNFLTALFLGGLFVQTKSIWYSFFVRWSLILMLDGIILYKIQNLKP